MPRKTWRKLKNIRNLEQKTKKTSKKSPKHIIKQVLKKSKENGCKRLCECGMEITKRNLTRCKKYQQHQQAMENLNNSNNV